MKKQIEIVIKWIAPVIILGIIYSQINSEFNSISNVFRDKTFSLYSVLVIVFLIMLMVLNWFLESFKWKLLIDKISITSNLDSFKAILNGLAFGLFTPFRVGDVVTRIAHIKSKERSNALGSVFIARSSQLTTTIIFGCISLFFYDGFYVPKWILILTILILLIFYFKVDITIKLVKRVNFLSNYLKYVDVINNYTIVDLMIALFISIVRLLVILMQYYLMFRLFSVELDFYKVLTGVSITLFVKSILPLISVLGDFGIRELVAIYVFKFYEINSLEILMITISIWLLNVVVPSVVGSFLSKNFKLSNH